MDLHESLTQHCGFVNLRKCKIGICQMKSFSGFLFQGCLSFLPQSPPIPYGCLGKFSGVPIHSDQTDEVYWKQVACSMFAFKTILITSDTYANADQLPNNPSIHPSILSHKEEDRALLKMEWEHQSAMSWWKRARVGSSAPWTGSYSIKQYFMIYLWGKFW